MTVMLTRLAVRSIRLYQRRRPRWAEGICRFEPSCSTYAIAALRRHGLVYGIRLALGRIVRCRPPHGGVDRVPLRRRKHARVQGGSVHGTG